MFKLVTIFSLLLLQINALYAKEITLNTTGKPPLNTPQLTGFMDLVVIEAFKRIGYTLKTVQLPAERGLKNANAGLVDGEMSRVKGLNKTYTNLVRVPEKIMEWEFVAFSQKNIDLSNGWKSLQPYTISFINGWKILEKNVPPSTNVTKVRTPDQLFSILEKKRTDLILYEHWGGLLYISFHPRLALIKPQFPPLAVKDMYIYLHNNHFALVQPLSKALQQMKQDGSYIRIVNKTLSHLK